MLRPNKRRPKEEPVEDAAAELVEVPKVDTVEDAAAEQVEEPKEEPVENAADEQAVEPKEEQNENSAELEPWQEVVQAAAAVSDEAFVGESEPETKSERPPHQDAEELEPDPEGPTPTGSFQIENPTDQEPTGWDQPSNPEQAQTTQEPTLVMAPPLVEQLIQESAATKDTDATPSDPKQEQVEREALITALESEQLEEREDAIEQLLHLGQQVDILIRSRFPGPIAFDPFAAGATTPALKDCNGLIAYLDRRGAQSVDIVSSHLQSSNPRARFFALYMMHHHAGAEHLDMISRRLYDTQPAIRIAWLPKH